MVLKHTEYESAASSGHMEPEYAYGKRVQEVTWISEPASAKKHGLV